MKKFINVVIALFVLTFAFFSFTNLSYAENVIDAENLSNVEATQETTQETTPESSNIKTSIHTSVNSTDGENEWLRPTNIINILLIAVGIVLILLAVAIFTRIKS